MHGNDGTGAPPCGDGRIAAKAADRAERVELGADLRDWACSEAVQCAALVRQGKAGREVGPLVAAALRATDALAHRPLPPEAQALLKASALEALRTLACSDGRQRRRTPPSA